MSGTTGKAKQDMKTLSTRAEDDFGHEIGIGDVQAVRLDKPFNIWSALGISFSVTSVPLAIGTYLSVSVGVGGSPVYFFGYIVSVVFNLCICASLGELAAVFPHSSGKYIILLFQPTLHSFSFLNRPLNILQARYTGHLNWHPSDMLVASVISLVGW
jgi:hypothetical protein